MFEHVVNIKNTVGSPSFFIWSDAFGPDCIKKDAEALLYSDNNKKSEGTPTGSRSLKQQDATDRNSKQV